MNWNGLIPANDASVYLVLAAMYASGTTAFALDKLGHGRGEDSASAVLALLFMFLTFPLMWIGGVGLIVGTVWAAIKLSFLRVLAIVVLVQVVWGSVCWYSLSKARINGWEHAIHAVGVPLVFVFRLITATAAVLLLVALWRGVA